MPSEEEPLDFERRQVHDVPPLKLIVTEHRAVRKVCQACKSTTSGAFPEGVSSQVQYGERLKAIGVYLQEYQLLPFWRAHEVLFDLFGGAAPSEGALALAKARCHERLEPIEAAIKGAIAKEAGAVNFDETGMRIGTKTHWVHHAGTESLTYYAHHQKRGTEALEAIGILSEFRGTSVHDCYASYFTYGECAHALCNAHLLRELIAVYEEEEEQQQQQWAGGMIELLVEIKSAVEQARAAEREQLKVAQREGFEKRYGELVAEGMRANPPPPPPPLKSGKRGRKKQSTAKNLLDRLEKYRKCVLRFMGDFRVPFDNNLSERDLRMVKVRQKISGCFRSEAGASQFCRIRGYISTLRKQGANVLSALQSVFAGKPYMPRLQT
jgi:transposase